MSQFTSFSVPESLHPVFLKRKNNIEIAFHGISDTLQQLLEKYQSLNQSSISLEAQFSKTLVLSAFVHDQLVQRPDFLVDLFESADLWCEREEEFYQKKLTELAASCLSTEAWMSILRKFRQREMIRFIWREANELSPLRQNMKELSEFARASIDVSLNYLFEKQKKVFGTPLSELDKSEQKMCVLAMGKLGGQELNLSSDIDLIFFYRDHGQCNGARAIDNQQFFVKLAQQLIRVLDERTADGFVFRVDMRLRPYGDSGLLVLNQEAMEHYYETQGRAWERYAFLKADAAAGDKTLGREFLESIKPFVYKKYVDFSVVESLREMKLMINRQVKSKGMENDIKLGEGGIRELEFIVQALQLIKGGRKTQLQTKSYYQAMKVVVDLELMTQQASDNLSAHYSFFRRLEHLIQAQADQQTQMLPADVYEQNALAWVMGCESYAALLDEIQIARAEVRNHFDDLFALPEDAKVPQGAQQLQQSRFELALSVWLDIEESQSGFAELKIKKTAQVIDLLTAFSREKMLSALGEIEKKRLDSCIAYLILNLSAFEEADEVLNRSLRFVRVILKRSAYFVLLNENPEIFEYLLSLFERSQWILDKLIQHPFLLDELLQLQRKKTLANRADLFDDMHQLSLRMSAHDMELRLEELRVFKCTHEFQAAVLYLDKHVSTTDLGDFLSHLAECLLQEVCRVACEEVSQKFKSKEACKTFVASNFAIIAYGKLGSEEMGFGSDLDLVFLYEENQSLLEEPVAFLTKLVQKIIHLLSLRTYSGILYEADMRLRPSGKAGQLVSALSAFEKYQQENAWTWEHQSLVKARVVVGSKNMQQSFEKVRLQILTRKREQATLLKDMHEMQLRLREKTSYQSQDLASGLFHMKSDEGGIVDIEFIAQYLVLMYSHELTDLAKVRATLQVFTIAQEQSDLGLEYLSGLREVYLLYRQRINELTLAYDKVLVPAQEYAQQRKQVSGVWQQLMANLDT